MKKMILSLASILLISGSSFAQDEYEPAPSSSSSSSRSKQGVHYSGAGAGAQISLVLAEKFGSYWGDLPAAAFGFGAQGIVEIDFGKIGKAQYMPSLQFWFRSDDDHYNGNYWNVHKVRDGMVALNILDLKYLPPLKESIIVRPYVGLGPAIVIHIEGYEYVHHATDVTPYEKDEDKWSDADAAFNFFIGADFKVTPILAPFVEARFTASNKKVFRLSGGLNVRF